MNLANIFTVRFFVIGSVLMAGLVTNGIMSYREYVAIPDEIKQTKIKSRLKTQRFLKSTRDYDVAAYGLPAALQRDVIHLIERKERQYKRRRPNPLVTPGMRGSDGLVRDNIKDAFCVRTAGTDPPYGAAAFLLKPSQTAQAQPLTLRQLSSGIEITHEYLASNIDKVYQKTELISHGNRTDMTCVAIAMMFLGTFDTTYLGGVVGDDGTEGGVYPTCTGLIRTKDGLRNRLLEYFSNFHYLAELAHDPKNKICKGS